jgi:hypothetical protein
MPTGLVFALDIEANLYGGWVMKSFMRVSGLAALLVGLCTSGAWALGTLITQEGTHVSASRTLIVRHAETIQIATQIKYGAATDNMVWLIAIPNFDRPADEGVRVEAFATSALNELDSLSRPTLVGLCDGESSNMTQEILQAESFGPGLDMRPATQFFSATEIEAGELNEYITGQGFEVSESLTDTIAQVVNQNFMFVAVRLNIGDLGVARVDPIISISYPADRGSNQKIALRPLNDVTSEVADLVFWVLDTDRAEMNLATRPMEFDSVEFISANETNYLAAFDAFVAVQQTQMFVVEHADALALPSISDDALSTVMSESGATYLTRMHARMVPAALRANAAFVILRGASGAAYDRTHTVEGFNCAATMPDAGSVDPMDDGGMVAADAGMSDGGGVTLTRGDGGLDDDAGSSGGGGGGGCFAAPGTSNTPLALLMLLLVGCPLTYRRLRR